MTHNREVVIFIISVLENIRILRRERSDRTTPVEFNRNFYDQDPLIIKFRYPFRQYLIQCTIPLVLQFILKFKIKGFRKQSS